MKRGKPGTDAFFELSRMGRPYEGVNVIAVYSVQEISVNTF